jgi:predicted ATP-dependent endonuclease of OLD family
MDEKTLPIESLGTGIHELVILATSATLLENSIICIEEPEIHFHPRLQKSFINYLYEKTTNQYFISTHSNSLMNLPYTSIFYVRLENGSSLIEPAITDRTKFSICEDLGFKASDLLQSNCVIWVEGPSDRIYLNLWLNSASPNLIEGVHYSIMFYGGSLLKHISAEDEEVKSFIKLRSINRKMCIVMDSDKERSNQSISQTKKRIQQEFNSKYGFAWVTKGREIENYIKPEVMEQVIKELYGNDAKPTSKTEYSKLWKYKKKNSQKIHEADKLKVAHRVITKPADLNILDLKKRITELVKFIESSNS